MSMMLITTGSESFKHGTTKLYVFTMPSPRFPSPGDTQFHVGQVPRLITNSVLTRRAEGTNFEASTFRVLSSDSFPAASGNVDQGRWTRTTFDLPEGLVLKVWARITREATPSAFRASPNVSALTRAVLIQVRETAPLYRMVCNRVQDARATNVPAVIEGRFDILEMTEAARMGVKFSDMDFNASATFLHHSRGMVMTITKLADEISARVETQTKIVKNDEGKQVHIPVARKRRMLDLE